MDMAEKTASAFLGFAVGDALGTPVEKETRETLALNPVTGMIGHQRRNQPPGTWSDNSSLVFCTCESLCNGYDLEDIAIQYSNWKNNRFWTPYRRVFTIDIQIEKAIERIDRFIEMGIRIRPYPAEGVSEKQNGNGSLMRILPLAFFLRTSAPEERFKIIGEVSSLTHPHIRAVTGCYLYAEFARLLLTTDDKGKAYEELHSGVRRFLSGKMDPKELQHYSRILDHYIGGFPESTIETTQYVVHSLEAALWSVMRGNSFRETVLLAVNLGGDTDTIGALAGGLAGLIYGSNQIPEEWLSVIARKEDIIDLAGRFAQSL